MLRFAIGGLIAAGVLLTVYVLAVSLGPPAGDHAGTLRGKVAAFEFFDSPQPVPETPFTTAEGKEVTLADFKGRVLLVNLWATWCAPCKTEMPTLDALQAEMGDDNFQVIAISMDRKGPEAARQFLKQQNLENIDVYMDRSGQMVDTFAARGLPFTILVDRNSKVVGRMLGPAQWDTPEAKALLRQYIEG